MRDVEMLSAQRRVATSRIVLSLAALAILFLTQGGRLVPMAAMGAWSHAAGQQYLLCTLFTHLVYGLIVYASLSRSAIRMERLVLVVGWGDVLFATVIATFARWTNWSFIAFYVFAVVASGFQGSFALTLAVTTTSVVLYTLLVAVGGGDRPEEYVSRAAALAFGGYLVAYLAQQRVALEKRLSRLRMSAERERIARTLHDGCVQALAAVDMRLESCRQLLRRHETERVSRDLAALQQGVRREFDALQSYVGELGDIEIGLRAAASGEPHFSVNVAFEGAATLVDHVLQILREGTANVYRHAAARSAALTVRRHDGRIEIVLEDDGRGIPADGKPPWSIDSRVRELGGKIEIPKDGAVGARVVIKLPSGGVA
jgi:signal transduction histidine kinase